MWAELEQPHCLLASHPPSVCVQRSGISLGRILLGFHYTGMAGSTISHCWIDKRSVYLSLLEVGLEAPAF